MQQCETKAPGYSRRLGFWHAAWCLTLLTLPLFLLTSTSTTALALHPEAYRYYQQALEAQKTGNLQQAAFALNQAIAIDPTDPLNYTKLAQVLQEMGQYSRALDALQKAASYNGQDAMLYFSMGELYEQLDNLPEARRAYETAIRNRPDYLFGLFPLGRVLARTGETDKAIAVFERFLQAYPQHQKGRRILAGLYLVTNRPERTVALLEPVRQQRPEAFQDDLTLAEAYNALKQPEKALEVVEAARKRGVTMGAFAEVSANARQALGQTQAAIDELLSAVEANPEKVENRLRLGALYLQTQQPLQAVEQLRLYQAAKPEDRQATYLLATAHLEAKQFAEARPLFEALLQAPADAWTETERFNLQKQYALTLQQTGQMNTAIAQYEALLQSPLGQNDADIRRNLAIAYHATSQLEKALPLYEQVLQTAQGSQETAQAVEGLGVLRQDFTAALIDLGQVQYEQGQYAEAQRYYRQALEQPSLEPSVRLDATLGLAHAAYSAGDKAEADQQFAAVLTLEPDHLEARLYKAKLDLEANRNVAQIPAQVEPVLADGMLAVEALLLQGDAYTRLEQWNKALERYQQAKTREPGNPQVWLALGDVYHRQNKLNEALKAFQQAAILDPANATALYNQASVHLSQGQLPQATAAFEKALAANPELTPAYYGLAVAYDRQKATEKAIAQYQAYLDRQPTGDYSQQAQQRLTALRPKQQPGQTPPTNTTSGGTATTPISSPVIAAPETLPEEEWLRLEPTDYGPLNSSGN